MKVSCDDALRGELHEGVVGGGDHTLVVALGRDEDGDAPGRQRVEHAVQFGPAAGNVAQPRQHLVQSVQHDEAERPLVGHRAQAGGQAVQLELARDQGLQCGASVEEGQAVADEVARVPGKAPGVGENLVLALLEGDERSRHAAPGRVREDLEGEDRLARAGRPDDECGSVLRQAAFGQAVQAFHTG